MPSSSTPIAAVSPTVVSARRGRYFPGWTMLGISAAAQFLSAPGQSYSVAAFKDPMRQGLAISETNFAAAYAVATIVSACLLPFVGRLVDRFGARVMLPVIAAGLGTACLGMSTVESLTELYVAFGFVRSLGQGALCLVSIWLIGEWFERKRGFATAIAGVGGGLSVMTIPVLNHWLIESYGWQTGWMVLGVTVWVVLIIPVIVLVRDRPEDLGLHPDGLAPARIDEPDLNEARHRQPKSPTITPTGESWTVGETVRDPTFWKLLSVPTTAGLVGTGLVFHQVALVQSHGFGITRLEALLLMTLQAGFATLMAIPAGWLTDRVQSRFILFAAMFVLAAATLLIMTLPFAWLVFPYALLLGLHGCVMRSTGQVVWINFYGRANQGAVRGVAWCGMILGSAAGPLPLALSRDHLGTWTPALCLFLVLPLLAATAVWTARPPLRASISGNSHDAS
ncbi:MAG: MFS transporter [Planctomycetota bacterium]|nr:MFS transporter [Planctomycetota bacterium]